MLETPAMDYQKQPTTSPPSDATHEADMNKLMSKPSPRPSETGTESPPVEYKPTENTVFVCNDDVGLKHHMVGRYDWSTVYPKSDNNNRQNPYRHKDELSNVFQRESSINREDSIDENNRKIAINNNVKACYQDDGEKVNSSDVSKSRGSPENEELARVRCNSRGDDVYMRENYYSVRDMLMPIPTPVADRRAGMGRDANRDISAVNGTAGNSEGSGAVSCSVNGTANDNEKNTAIYRSVNGTAKNNENNSAMYRSLNGTANNERNTAMSGMSNGTTANNSEENTAISGTFNGTANETNTAVSDKVNGTANKLSPVSGSFDQELCSAKSIPVHCIVEHQAGTSPELQVDRDTYAILPASTLFCELVRSALVKIGFSPTEALGAKGAIQIKRWKPLTFDTITDDPDATLDEILGEVSSIATLRIRLCSHLQLFAMEDIKDKLLQFLLLHSQSLLTSTGCPIDQNLLVRLAQGESPKSLPPDTQQAFTDWFTEQVQKGEKIKNTEETSENQSELNSSSPDQVHQMSPNLPQGTGMPHELLNSDPPAVAKPYQYQPHQSQAMLHTRPRARTSFDPEHEVPRLHKWFELNQHPNKDQMCEYMNELNRQPSRQGRRPLDLTNIVYWFKNARAANRRALVAGNRGNEDVNGEVRSRRGSSGCLDVSFGGSSNGDFDDYGNERDANSPETSEGHNEDGEDRHVPELPNPFAVYQVKPIHHSRSDVEKSAKVEVLSYDIDDVNKPQDFSVGKKSVGDGGEIENIKPAHHNDSLSSADGNDLYSKLPLNGSFKDNKRDYYGKDFEEQATDLRLPKKRALDETNGYSENASKISRLLKLKEEPATKRLQFQSLSSSNIDGDDEEDSINGEASSDELSPRHSPRSPAVFGRMTPSSGNLHPQQPQHPQDLLMFRNMLHHMAALQAINSMPYSHHPHPHHLNPATMYGATPPMVPHLPAVTPPTTPGYPRTSMHNSVGGNPVSMATDTPRPTPSPSSNSSQQGGSGGEDRKKRSRVFIDPLTEIPKLEKWFIEDTHPSSYMIEKYTEELNMQAYRQRFPCLEPKNVQLWFKNHRAKVKRARQEQAALCQINRVGGIPT